MNSNSISRHTSNDANDDYELYSIDSSGGESYSVNNFIEGSPINKMKTRTSQVSKGNSLMKTVTNKLKEISSAVYDDYVETEENGHDLNHVLEKRFELGDAIRLQSHIQDNNEDEGKESVDALDDISEDRESFKSHDIESSYQSIDNNETNLDTLSKVFTNKSTGKVELPPDQGYAWVAVFCVFLVMINTWGCNSAFGVFLSFFLSHNTFAGATKYDYAIIAGLPIALAQGCAPFSMIIMRIIGIRATMSIGTAIMFSAFMWASYAKNLWELYFTQGFMIGISIALIGIPSTTVVPGWFLKKRAVAMGISLLGTGAGGVIFGLASNKMISDHNNTDWCYRMLAITCTCCVIIAIILIKERNPVKPVGFRSPNKIWLECKKIFDFSVVRRPVVILIASWFNLALFGYCLMVYTLASFAVARGLTLHQGSILTAVLNGAQTIGRPTMGLLGDKMGRTNVTVVLTFCLTTFMFAFWIPISTFVQFIVFSAMVGSCVGVANVMNTVLIADMVGPNEFLTAWSFVTYAGSPLLLVCEIVAQALIDKNNKTDPYINTQIFTGCCFVAALLLGLCLREVAVKIKLTKRQTETKMKLDEREFSMKGSSGSSNNVNSNISFNGRDTEHWNSLEKRQHEYDVLLSGGIKQYFIRMFYPMNV